MLIDEEGRVISTRGICPEVIGRHWNYCGFKGNLQIYSHGGILWYALGNDDMVQVIDDEVNASPCSVWEMLNTKRVLGDVEFIKIFRNCIIVKDFIDAGIKEDKLLEGLLA